MPAGPGQSSLPEAARASTAVASPLSPLVIAGRYRLRRLLKAGNAISTFLADDELAGDELAGAGAGQAASPEPVIPARRVVVKTTPLESLSTTAWLRLQHEAAVVSTLLTPGSGVVAGRDGEIAYLVQPFIDGTPLDDLLARGPLGIADTLVVAQGLLATLERMHAGGVIHRDLKPANVIVGPGSPPAWAELIDFGLARSNRLPAAIRDLPVGTAQFSAPEQAGLLEVDVDERADLYALGALLFACLTGRPPFQGDDAGEVLRSQIAAPVPSLASVVGAAGPWVPGAVEALVQRLLRKDPADRYQSATAVRADVAEIAAAIERGQSDPPVLIGLHDRRATLTEPAFVGRAADVDELTRQLDRLVAGQGGLIAVESESGGGKTRLLEELSRRAEQRALWILRGQGQDQTGTRPFQMLEGVARGILRAAEADGGLGPQLRQAVGEHAASIAAALPELAPLLQPAGGSPAGAPGGEFHAAEGSLGPESYGEARSLMALPTLLGALGRQQRPAVVILDDCQWADVLTARLLARWQASAGSGGWVSVVVAFRTEEVGVHHPLRGLRPAAHLRLRPLDASEISGLIQSMAGPLPGAAIQTVARLSSGNPFMAAAVLRGMVECGALVASQDAWTVDPVALRGVQASRRAASFLLRRMDLLSPEALALVSVGAVLGKEFDLELGVALAHQHAGEAVPALAEAQTRRIVWVDEDGNRCVFFHDKLREALLERLPPDERRALHLRAAERIEAQAPDQVFELAYHFDAAGAPERALPYALAAGARARAQYALEVAETQYRIAHRAASVPGATADQRRRAAEGLGEVLSLRGSYPEATQHLREARTLAGTQTERAQLNWRLGEVAFRCGNVNEALGELEAALGELGRRVPGSRVLLALALLAELAVQAAHSVLPRCFVGRRRQPMPEAEGLAARVYSRLAYVNWFRSGRLPCAWAHLRGMNMAERWNPGPELAQAYSEHAPVMTMIPWYRRGIEYARRSLAIRTALGDHWGQGQSLSFLGVVRYAASDFPGTIDCASRAIRLLERTGDRWECNTAAWHFALARYRAGDLRQAAELAEHTYHHAMEIGDQAAAGISLSVWSRATGGQVPARLVAQELGKRTDDAHTATELRIAEAVRLLHEGQPAAAAAQLRAAAGVVAAAGLRQEYVAPVQPWLATALRTEAEACGPFARAERRRLARAALRAARRGRRLARHYRNNLPYALRELALTTMMAGRPARARRLIDESLAAAAAQGANHEHTLSLAARGRMGTAAGWVGAAADLAAAMQAHAQAVQASGSGAGPVKHGDAEHYEPYEEATSPAGPDGSPAGQDGQPAEATLSLLDRFTGLLEAGRTIAAAASLPALREAVGDATLRLLHGEAFCFLELTAVDDSAEPVTVVASSSSSAGEPEVSRTLVRQAVSTGRPATDRAGGSATDSLELAGIRSAICAPIKVDGRVVQCLYVTNGHVGGLFGPDEEQLAAFIAALAGAALEHLAGSEARFRSLVEHASDVITVVDQAGIIQYQSSSLARVFGYEGSGLVRTPVKGWVHPDEAEGMVGRISQLAGGQPAGSMECRLRHADGSWRPAEITFSNLLEEAVIQGIVLNIRDLTELRWQETHDALTGLPNRVLFTEQLAEALEAPPAGPLAVAGSPGPAVVYADLDDFKAVNDLLGHRAGDAVLAAIGKRLKAAVGPGDCVARFGGDEFAIFLPSAAPGEPEALAARLIAQLGTPLMFGNHEVRVEASLGIARAIHGQGVSDVLARADLAMYEAKHHNRGRYRVFEQAMRSAAVERSTLKAELAGALERDEFVLHYQPIVDLTTVQAVGLEALLRWRHPRRGLLIPANFMAVAEDSNQMFELGSWVLRESCIQAAGLPANWAGPGKGHVSVNVSGRQIEDPRFLDAVRQALTVSRLEPRRLILEITETAMVRNIEATMGRLVALKDLGIKLAVDDFGTGYSSLRYLHELPVDVIKIDKAFVSSLGDDPEMELLTETIIGLGRSLGLTTVAEGVETPAQADKLRAFGCELAQGYYYSYPVDTAGLMTLLLAA
jgi:diguanylate cyclase (GGDEF)-like protein/PAS domain S-box-containing protein